MTPLVRKAKQSAPGFEPEWDSIHLRVNVEDLGWKLGCRLKHIWCMEARIKSYFLKIIFKYIFTLLYYAISLYIDHSLLSEGELIANLWMSY